MFSWFGSAVLPKVYCLPASESKHADPKAPHGSTSFNFLLFATVMFSCSWSIVCAVSRMKGECIFLCKMNLRWPKSCNHSKMLLVSSPKDSANLPRTGFWFLSVSAPLGHNFGYFGRKRFSRCVNGCHGACQAPFSWLPRVCFICATLYGSQTQHSHATQQESPLPKWVSFRCLQTVLRCRGSCLFHTAGACIHFFRLRKTSVDLKGWQTLPCSFSTPAVR